MKTKETTKVEKKKNEELAKLFNTLRKLYSSYCDSLNRISPDIRGSLRREGSA